MNGYMGKILHVDLSTGRLWDEPLKEEHARAFVGGSGLAAHIIYDVVHEDTDPLGPHNPLVFMTGPLVGTAMPSAGRYSVCALSPLTRIWGEANSGGFFGPELRFAGYDGVVITGCSSRPVWLSIVEGNPQLHDASNLWSSDSYATQQMVRQALRDEKARVACIGVAGENKVKMAAVMNDHGRAAGRTGMGAVMGSKKLKAIGVRGSAKVPVADPERFKTLVRGIIANLDDAILPRALRLAGTAGTLDSLLMYGDMPIRYYQQGDWDNASNLSGIVMAERYQTRIYACYRCPIGCGRETRAPSYGLDKVDGMFGDKRSHVLADGHAELGLAPRPVAPADPRCAEERQPPAAGNGKSDLRMNVLDEVNEPRLPSAGDRRGERRERRGVCQCHQPVAGGQLSLQTVAERQGEGGIIEGFAGEAPAPPLRTAHADDGHPVTLLGRRAVRCRWGVATRDHGDGPSAGGQALREVDEQLRRRLFIGPVEPVDENHARTCRGGDHGVAGFCPPARNRLISAAAKPS